MNVFVIHSTPNAVQNDGAKPLESSQAIENEFETPIPESINEANEIRDSDPSTDKKDLMVKVDGPVGRVFTDALNKVLANESYMTTTPSLINAEDDREGLVDLRVYAWKADKINTQDVVDITNDITKSLSRDYIIAVEGDTVTNSLGLLDELSSLKNVKLVHGIENAISHITHTYLK